jgi:acyl-CoA synthetase (AMP-forming)/AMP-acid ligase II
MELHPATLWEAIADVVPDRLAIVQGAVRTTWREFDQRSARLAAALLAHGVGAGARVGQLLYNSPEFIESYHAALKIRAVPFNVNYRYTGAEIAYLLDNADADVLFFHSSLGGVVADAVGTARPLTLLIEVPDSEDHLEGSLRYEEAITASAPAERIVRDENDTTMVYTGGTTGMPKGVVTKVGWGLTTLLDTVPPLLGHAPLAIDDVPSFAAALEEWMVSLPAPPLMHNTGLGIGVAPALATGGTVVLLEGRRFDPVALWDTVSTERVNAITVVGDPFARPMLAALEEDASRDLRCVQSIASSGAMFSTEVKSGLLEHLPRAMIIDLIAASEGSMGMSISTAQAPVPTGRFRPSPGVIVITEEGEPIEPGSGQAGLVALLGGAERYHKDEAKSAATFRIIGGQRYTIPGDYAVVEADGTLVLLGRGSSCINTAGEKVYPEEVEEVLKAQPSVEDALVFGVEDERFGQKVAAVISRTANADAPIDEILTAARVTLAAFKVPRSVVIVDVVPRTSVGKADYEAARRLFHAQGEPAVPSTQGSPQRSK